MSGDKSSKDKSGHPAKSAADPFQAEYDSALKLSKEVGDHERLALTYMQAVPPASKKTNVNDYTKKQAAVTNEINAAIKTADASQAVANRVMSDFNKTREGTREALAKHFGFDPAKFSEQDIENKLRSGNLDRHQREKLEELAELQKEWLTLKELRETPGITRTQAAYIKASGKLDALPSMPIQQQVIVDGRNADEAFSLLRQAAQLDAGGNLVKSQSFAAVTDAVNNRYGRYQLDLCLQIQGTLDLGDKLMKDPSKMARGEQQYQIASDLSSKVNLNFIAAHQEELGTHGNQKGPLDLRDAYALLEGSVSRQAQTLISHGQNQKALPLLVKLMANVPELFDKPAFQAELLTAEIGAGSIKHDPSTHMPSLPICFLRRRQKTKVTMTNTID